MASLDQSGTNSEWKQFYRQTIKWQISWLNKMDDAEDRHYLLNDGLAAQCLQKFNRSSFITLPRVIGVWTLVHQHFAFPQILKRDQDYSLHTQLLFCMYLQFFPYLWGHEKIFWVPPPGWLLCCCCFARVKNSNYSPSSSLPIHGVYAQHISAHNQKFVMTGCACVVQNNTRKRLMVIFINGHKYMLEISASHEIFLWVVIFILVTLELYCHSLSALGFNTRNKLSFS